MCVGVFAALLPAVAASRAHADGHAVAVTSPAPATLTGEQQGRAFLAAHLGK